MKIELSEIGLQTNITYTNSIEQVEIFSNMIDKIQLCNAAVSSMEYTDIKSLFGPQYIESNGQWRHRKCNIVLKHNDDIDG